MESDFKILLPLYRNSERRTLLASLQVPCADDKRRWIQAGAAFFLRN